jgi:hypothetical protein
MFFSQKKKRKEVRIHSSGGTVTDAHGACGGKIDINLSCPTFIEIK